MKKKITALALSILMAFGTIPMSVFTVFAENAETTAEESTETSDSTIETPAAPVEISATYDWYDAEATEYEIDSIEDLAGLAKLTQGNVVIDETTTLTKTDFAGKTVKLTADLTFADNRYWYYNDGTTTFDYIIKGFAGIFDGNEKTITGLKINNTVKSISGLGLFSAISGSISDITLDSVTGNFADNNQFGFIAANLTGTATNCHVSNVTVTSSRRVYGSGMMFGSLTGSASVTGCTVKGVTGIWSGDDNTDGVGTLIGTSYGSKNADTGEEIRVTISDCSVSDLTFSFTRKTKRFGAFIGKADYTDISNCNASDISITCDTYSQELGGFVGYAGGGSVYKDCHVSGFKFVCNDDSETPQYTQYAGCNGGFVGYSAGSDISFTNCTVTGLDWDINLGADYKVALGGFAGYLTCVANIEGCSASGSIEAIGGMDGDIPIGGFIGGSYKTINVSECTADVDVTTTGPAGGFIGACTGGDSNFANCEALGDVVSLESAAGGFAGTSNAGTFENCEASGDVSGDTAGGFIGEILPNSANIDITIADCASNGTVTGETVASGFVGALTASGENDTNVTNITIQNSTATSNVKSENGTVVNFATETVPNGSTSHLTSVGNFVKFDKDFSISTDSEVYVAGDNISVSVNIDGEGAFNSSELELSYSENLTFNEEASTLYGAEVTAANGVLKLADYGEAQSYGKGVYILVFTVNSGSTATISVISAGFGTSESAETENLSQADCSSATVTVTVRNSVTLNTIFSGESSVANGDSYTFGIETVTGIYYDYELPTATVDGVAVTVIANDDGTYTVENVTGQLVISGVRTPKIHSVTISGDNAVNDGDNAVYGTDYTFTLADDLAASTVAGYTYSVESITIGGVNYTGYSAEGRVYTIKGTDIIGEVVITIRKTDIAPNQFNITTTGSGAGSALLSSNVVDKEGDVILTLVPETGYIYTITAGDHTVSQVGDTYTVSNITAAVEFTVERTVDVSSATVREYVTLDGSRMWIVKIGEDMIDGKFYTYGGQAMLWSDKYDSYITLVVSDSAPSIEPSDFDITTGTATVFSHNMDVNMSGIVDANDAQLVWNIYNAKYSDFTETVTIEKFLRADVNCDCIVNMIDAVTVVNYILAKS